MNVRFEQEETKKDAILPPATVVHGFDSADDSAECGDSDKELITECFIPLNQKWNKMIGDRRDLHSVVFPLFRYQKWDIFELCNMRLVALQVKLSTWGINQKQDQVC